MPASPIAISAISATGDDAAQAAQAAQALALLRAGLGQGFISDERFRWYTTAHAPAEPPTPQPFRSALAATESATRRVVGALTIEIADPDAINASFLDHHELINADADLRRLLDGATGLIKSIAVAPASQGRGVASALIARGMQELAAHGATQYYSLAWVRQPLGCALCGVLAALGFRPARLIERFWYRESLAHGYHCPACGNPCACAAQVMVRYEA